MIHAHIVSTQVKILTAQERAQGLKVKPSWVIEAGRAARNSGPLPLVKIGRHNRYGWNSKSLTAGLNRRGLKGTHYRLAPMSEMAVFLS
jgi:hypothetical protein